MLEALRSYIDNNGQINLSNLATLLSKENSLKDKEEYNLQIE